MAFIEELQRRKVVRVAIGYAVVGWALVQVAATAFPLLHIPERYATFVLIAALLGFPVALVLAWVFDLTPAGLRRTAAGGAPAPDWPLSWRLGFIVAAVLLVSAGAYATWHRLNRNDTPDRTSIRTIAVLPFRNLSSDPEQQYFSDGIAEELLNELARVEGLNVVARTSSFTFRDADSAQAQRELHVQALLTGSVQRENQRVRVNAQLVDATTGVRYWSNHYDRSVESILDMQREITKAIIDTLQVRLDAGLLAPQGTRNPAALDAYLEGLSLWHERGAENLQQALILFGRATKADPNYAQAFAGTALTYAVLTLFDQTVVPSEVAAKGKAAAERALSLDARSAEAYAALSQIALNLNLDVRSAAVAAKRAVELKPSYATAHQWYAEVLQVQGSLVEARRELERALQLDPLSPAARNIMGFQLAIEGKIDEAIAYWRALLKESPDFDVARQVLTLMLMSAQRYEEAAREWEQMGMPPQQLQATVAIMNAAAARRDGRMSDPVYQRGLVALQGLERAVPAVIGALFNVAMRRDDHALELLTRAAEQRQPTLGYFIIWPGFNPLRGRPEFKKILRQMGVETTEG